MYCTLRVLQTALKAPSNESQCPNIRKLSAVLPWTFSGGGGGVRWMFANLDLEAHKASLRKDDIECKPLKRSGGSFDNTLAALC